MHDYKIIQHCVIVLQEQFSLEESHLHRVALRIKAGKSGDSIFIKNVASAVFGDEVLIASSVTGVKCNAKKNSVAKPALCPKRLDYIKSKIKYFFKYNFLVSNL